MYRKTIEEVLRENTKSLMSVPGVIGTGQGVCGDKPCIMIYVAETAVDLSRQIPSVLEGYQIEIKYTGAVKRRSD